MTLRDPAPKTSSKTSRSKKPPDEKYGDLTLAQFMAGLRQVEHSGSYDWSPNSIGARGAYQFMSYEAWAQEAGVNPNDHSPQAQDTVAAFKLRQYLRAYHGDWGMVAAAWFGGPGGAHAWKNGSDPSDGAINTTEYVHRVLTAAGTKDPATYIPSPHGGSSNYGTAAFGTPQPLTVNEYLDNPQIQEKYGYLTAYLKNPEIGPILAKAAKNGWGANQLLGALTETDWWQKKSQTARAWQAQKRLDPATAQQRLGQMTRQVQTLARSTLGYRLDDDRAQHIANAAIASDWSQQDLQHAIGAEFHYHAAKDALRGAAGQTIDSFHQLSQAYLVPLSKKTIGKWTRGVLEGVYQPKDFEAYVKNQAKSLYPTLAAALDSGQTVRDYLNPYAELAGQTLEIDPAGIDWFNPKWAKALNTTTPDGQRAPMSLSDWATYLRSLPDYQGTQGAQAQEANFGLTLAQTFGRVAV